MSTAFGGDIDSLWRGIYKDRFQGGFCSAALSMPGEYTAFDVVELLRKLSWHVSGYDVELKAEQSSKPPAAFSRVFRRHKLRSRIQPETVLKATHLSNRRNCSVTKMIAKTAKN